MLCLKCCFACRYIRLMIKFCFVNSNTGMSDAATKEETNVLRNDMNIYNILPNKIDVSATEKIKIEINIDKEDILETVDILDKSLCKINNEIPLFVQPFDQNPPTIKLNFMKPFSDELLLSLPKCCQNNKPTKTVNLKQLITSQPGPVIPGFMVPESLQHFACKQGYRFEIVQTKKRKRSLPYAESDWFYSESNSPSKSASLAVSKKPKPNLNDCKALLVKAHHLKALKMQTARRSQNLFEVEYIADFKVAEGKRYYLVKWVGWPSEANTWEPITNLSCPTLIQEFHEDYTQKLSEFLKKRNLSWNKLLKGNKMTKHVLQRLYDKIPKNFHFVSNYTVKKQTVAADLRSWQKKINQINKGLPMIAVENEVDLETLPKHFNYVVSNIPGTGVDIPTDPILGCQCVGGCKVNLEKGKCCPSCHKGRFAYRDGLIVLKPGRPIFECNSRCTCGPNCPNRVIQRGSHCAISLFRTSNGKGWGVKALQPIIKGSFVMEYVGEIITNEEAERRGKEYDSNGITYLFDLDFCDSENPLTVDATNYGNISHFVNHSCSPNLQVYNVFIDNLDPSLPRIALFARRNIAINEELTFDYQMTGDMTDGQCVEKVDVTSEDADPSCPPDEDQISNASHSSTCSSIKKRTRCLCGSSKCRLWLI